MNYKALSENSLIEIANMVNLGKNVVFGRNCKKIKIGFGSIIGRDVYIDCEYLSVGEYTTIHHGSIIHGKNCYIGHNCWFGHYTIIDSVGGCTKIGNNVGVGAHSQLWSHMKFGDVLEGCRWENSGSLTLEDDVWLVGHSITGPIKAGSKSMLLTGGIAVKDMLPNHIYAGSPAKDVTEKFGNQFIKRSLLEKEKIFEKYLNEYSLAGNDVSKFSTVEKFNQSLLKKGITQFNLSRRQYWPTYSESEYNFVRFLLYEKAKFLPHRE